LAIDTQKTSLTPRQISRISISLASPDSILAKSYGEVLKPETINYRSFKPEKDGLFCEKIFGPVKDWECHCGKYKRIRYKGIICDRCGVEVTLKSVRRERMGHIALATPVVHIWYFRSTPSKIGYLLNMSIKDLEKVIYYESYVVISPGTTGLKARDLIPEDEYFRIMNEFGEENKKFENNDPRKFKAMIGGDAIKELLRTVNLEELSDELRTQVKTETSVQRKKDALKRLKVIDAFKDKVGGFTNKPEWMVLDVIPVIPPELRPLVPLEGGRFATSDINDLYRRVIIRNNRLKKLIEIKAPEVILRNEKRMLQEAVDSLFDNGKRTTAVRSDGNRALKSLSDMLKGKQGRFRQNLLGKRVDYSGRSVIVVGPELNLYECGLPKDMAVELFKPFIIRKLVEKNYVKTVKSAKKVVDKKGKEVWDLLEDIIEDHSVLLNRAPTLHRLGIQAFQPKLIEGKAIKIHPLVCAAFNADFDGDQMAVHIPLSYEAQAESRILMLSSHNILSPSNGAPLAVPSQDIVLGCYYLTKSKSGCKGEGKMFSNPEETLLTYDLGIVDLHAKVKVRIDGKIYDTTVGRVKFYEIFPEGLPFENRLMNKKRISEIIAICFRKLGILKTSQFLDELKNIGFEYATKGGLSIGISDLVVPEEKKIIVSNAQDEVDSINEKRLKGILTEGERYNKIIDIWTQVTGDVSDLLFDRLSKHRQGFNPIFMMADSGARGSRDQIRQLAGMRGLMQKPQKTLTGQTGEIVESPITANFKEGLSVLEYFISTHGARKGLADTALKTADAGYLTRRLVDVSQDVIISEEDCGTILGMEMSALKEGEEIIQPLSERILGRVASEDVIDPATDEIIVEAGEEIDEDRALKISETSIEKVTIRSVLTCETNRGVCAKCYGRNLATGEMAQIGDAVGIIAAQSIGEPGTQLTLRTFHIGGIAQRFAAQSQAESNVSGIAKFQNVKSVERKDGNLVSLGRHGKVEITDEDGRTLSTFNIPYGAQIFVKEDDKVKKGDILFQWDPYSLVILSDKKGIVNFVDIKDDITVHEELDEQSGRKQSVIIESKDKKVHPMLNVVNEKGEKLASYILPTGSILVVKDQAKVEAGDVLVKIPRAITKTRDITGGLPRVAELFEARKPKDPAVISEIDGMVKIGMPKKGGVREITVTGKDGTKKVYVIPHGKHIIVQDGDYILAGTRLTEGALVHHDILKIKGTIQVAEYLVNEIQEVYRLQGVKVNDKHIEIIVRQMLQKVRVEDPGDTNYLPNDIVNRYSFLEENDEITNKVVITDPGDSKFRVKEIVNKFNVDRVNERLKRADSKEAKYREAVPATFQPILLGITQASLSTESFFSAASFQETTRVLTDAAVNAKVDRLTGLKENIIIGNLIPAGTGLAKYSKVKVESEDKIEEKIEEEVQEEIEDTELAESEEKIN